MNKILIAATAVSVAACIASLTFALGRANAALPEAPRPSASNRYAVFFSPHAARDTFLVDTATGRAWQAVDNKDGQVVWQLMPRDTP